MANETNGSAICQGCGRGCPLDALSCNRGRQLNGVATTEGEDKGNFSHGDGKNFHGKFEHGNGEKPFWHHGGEGGKFHHHGHGDM